MSKHLNLPEPIAAYFAADRRDGDTVAQCFTSDGVVTDEGRTHAGREAIKKWRAEAVTKYMYTCEPFAMDESDGAIVVTSRLEGNFPGSPVNLKYRFRLGRGRIEKLEIAP
jgi:hypothetical protein